MLYNLSVLTNFFYYSGVFTANVFPMVKHRHLRSMVVGQSGENILNVPILAVLVFSGGLDIVTTLSKLLFWPCLLLLPYKICRLNGPRIF